MMKYAGFLIIVIGLVLLTPVEAIPFDVLELKLGRLTTRSVDGIAALYGQEPVELDSNAKRGMRKEPSRWGNRVPDADLLQNYPNPFNTFDDDNLQASL